MEFWIDFSGYLKIKAKDHQEAESKFWNWVNSISANEDFSDDVWDVDNIGLVDGETDF